MSLTDLYIRDKQTGKIRRIGDNQHDQLTINDKGQLCYYNLQNGDGCRTGDDGGGYAFMPNQDENGFNADPTSCSEIPNSSDLISRQGSFSCGQENVLVSKQMTIDLLDRYFVNPPEYMKDYSDKLLHAIKDDLVDDVNSLPSEQPERKMGKWRHYEGYLTCSECGTEYDDDIMTHCGDDVPKFCPDCGADMREVTT